MANLFSSMLLGNAFPYQPRLRVWYDVGDLTTITKAYQTITPTGTGTSGASSFTASADVTNVIPVGAILKLGGDSYTVTSISIVTVGVSPVLSTNYVAGAIQLDKVSRINDKSGRGIDAVQVILSGQPIYVPANIGSVAAIVGMDAGVMTFANIPNIHLGFSNINVTKYNQDTSANNFGNVVTINGGSTNVAQRQPLFYFAKSPTRLNISVGTFDAAITSVSAGQNLIGYCQYDGATTIKTSVNTQVLTTNTVTQLTSSISAGAILQGATKGSFSELMLWDGQLLSAEYLLAQRYLATKYGITVS